MAQFDVSVRDLVNRRFSLDTGETHSIVVSTLDGFAIEMADVHFNVDSAVLLPDEGATMPVVDSGASRITGLAVLLACHLHTKAHPSQRVVIAGHTDTTGKP